MEKTRIKELLEKVASGKVSAEEALEKLRVLPFEEMQFAKVDHHRALRRGVPEVIFCQGKTDDQIVEISGKIMGQGVDLLATRCGSETFARIRSRLPEAVYHRDASLFVVIQNDVKRMGRVAIISAGTSDMPVVEEAAQTAYYFGCNVDRFNDVGVSGIHRLFSCWEEIRKADVIIVVAGMEGALASVVAGIADAPIISVPTSVGYGASFGGLAALLAMLNSCAGGVTVVNIDNGFGAAYAAAVICRKIYSTRDDR